MIIYLIIACWFGGFIDRFLSSITSGPIVNIESWIATAIAAILWPITLTAELLTDPD